MWGGGVGWGGWGDRSIDRRVHATYNRVCVMENIQQREEGGTKVGWESNYEYPLLVNLSNIATRYVVL